MKLPSVNFKEIGSTVTRLIGKGKLWSRVHEPELWIGAGLAVGVGAVVAAGIQGTKCHDIIERHQEHMEEVNKAAEYAEMDGTTYTKQDQLRDKWAYHVQDGVDIAKKFVVPGLMVVAAGAMIIKGFGVQKARTRAAIRWGQGILCAFGAYRANVIVDQGAAKDKYYLTGLKDTTVEETKFDENGKAYTEEKVVEEGKLDARATGRLFSFIFSPVTSFEAYNDGEANLRWLQNFENKIQLNTINNWYTDYNWILEKAGLSTKYYPPTAYGQLFGVRAKKTEYGWKREIHLDAHIIPGRDDGACYVTVYGMEPLVDTNDVIQTIGEGTHGLAYLEDLKDDIIVPTGGTCASEFMWDLCEKAAKEDQERTEAWLAKVNEEEY